MPRGLHNWTAPLVMRFLRKNGFTQSHQRGSHMYYAKKTKTRSYLVTVSFHGADSIHPKTMKSIIAQSGISQSVWEQM